MKDKKLEFVKEYLASGDAKESALKVGYKNAEYGYRLLKNPKVLEYINDITSGEAIASAEEVLSFLTSVMRGEEWEIKVTMQKETGEKLLQGEPPALSQRQKAAEMLAKRYRLFSEEPPENSDKPFCVNIKII